MDQCLRFIGSILVQYQAGAHARKHFLLTFDSLFVDTPAHNIALCRMSSLRIATRLRPFIDRTSLRGGTIFIVVSTVHDKLSEVTLVFPSNLNMDERVKRRYLSLTRKELMTLSRTLKTEVTDTIYNPSVDSPSRILHSWPRDSIMLLWRGQARMSHREASSITVD